LLGGEAFSSTLAEQWSRCVPNTQIQNVYGPTEATINTHIFSWNSNKNSQKSNNGILSIGKCFGDSFAIIVDQNLKALPDLQKGELCLGGDQISRGYWKDPKKTNDAFFEIELDGRLQRIYRTGDLVYKDEDGDFMFCGRLDSQVQIQGYRVELGEIEKHARDFLDQSNVAVLPIVNTNFVTEIFLFIENAAGKESEMLKYLETKIPSYMLPRNIINIQIFPKSSGGKINRKELEKILTNGITERD
jgi:acyl-coenzyme A synthetase/AMP-(fatty) acid ligase